MRHEKRRGERESRRTGSEREINGRREGEYERRGRGGEEG